MQATCDAQRFAYTLGLTAHFAHPEVLLTGLSVDTMSFWLDSIGNRVRDGARFRDGMHVEGIFDRYPARFAALPQETRVRCLASAAAFYGERPFLVLQCLWPDKAGHFPDDPGFNPRLRGWQDLPQR